MTEIRLVVDLKHPPERVWRALTDSRPLSAWFTPVERDPADRGHYQFRPPKVDGFPGVVNAQVVEVCRGTRLVMRWEGDDLHVRVSLTIEPMAGGSRLTMVQRGFLGRKGTLRRRVLLQAYTRMLHYRLPATLDQLLAMESTGSVDSGQVRAALLAALTARPSIGRAGVRTPVRRVPGRGSRTVDPDSRVPASTPGGPGAAVTVTKIMTRLPPPTQRPKLATASLVAGLLLGLSGLVMVGLPGGDRSATGPAGKGGTRASPTVPGTGVLQPSGPAPSRSDQPAPASPTPNPGSATGPAAVLTAGYAATSLHRGYRADIMITNSGQVPGTGWTVVVRLTGGTARVTAVQGATLRQDDALLTFTPAAATATVPIGGSVRFGFTVTGGGPTVSCEINGTPCTGL